MQKILYALVSLSLLLLLTNCEIVEEYAAIPECKSISSSADCLQCCIDNGWDSGMYLITENQCECRNLED